MLGDVSGAELETLRTTRQRLEEERRDLLEEVPRLGRAIVAQEERLQAVENEVSRLLRPCPAYGQPVRGRRRNGYCSDACRLRPQKARRAELLERILLDDPGRPLSKTTWRLNDELKDAMRSHDRNRSDVVRQVQGPKRQIESGPVWAVQRG